MQENLSLESDLLKPLKNKLEKAIETLTKNAIFTGKEAEITLKVNVCVVKKEDKDFNEYLEPSYEYQLTEKIKESKGTHKGNVGYNYSIELDKDNNILVQNINKQETLFEEEN